MILFRLEVLLDSDGNVIMTEGLVLQDEKIWCEFVNKDIVHKIIQLSYILKRKT